MTLRTVQLRAVGQYRDSFHLVSVGADARVRNLADDGYAVLVEGEIIGFLPRSGEPTLSLERGWEVFAAKVDWCNGDASARAAPGIGVSVFYSFGPPSAYDLATLALYNPDPPTRVREYTLGLVGESHCQAAVRRCRAGDRVELRHDRGNEYDHRAIAAFVREQRIGFLPRDGWLTEVILDERKPVTATIATIGTGAGGHLGVVLEVSW